MNSHDSQRNRLAGNLLVDFGAAVDEVSAISRGMRSIPDDKKIHVQYLMTVREGTDSAQQRKRRERILEDHVLAGVFENQDVRRAFTDEQRRILWARSGDKICNICGKPIRNWRDMHADHIEAHVKGGRTTLSNGAITHKTCNLSKGARNLGGTQP